MGLACWQTCQPCAALCPPLQCVVTCQASNCATCQTGSTTLCQICNSGYTAVAGECVSNNACISSTPYCAGCQTAANTPVNPDPNLCFSCTGDLVLDGANQVSGSGGQRQAASLPGCLALPPRPAAALLASAQHADARLHLPLLCSSSRPCSA